MDDIIKSLKLHINERITSPLFGTFAIAWAFWNYKFIVVLFSSMPTLEKFDYIAKTLYPTFEAKLWCAGLYPFLTAVAFIFVYPWPARFVYEFNRNRQKELNEIRQKIEDETLLSVEESRELRRAMNALKSEYDLEIGSANNEISNLKSENKKLKDHAFSSKDEKDKRLSNKYQYLLKEMTNDELSTLELIYKSGEISVKSLATKTSVEINEMNRQLHNMESLGFVKHKSETNDIFYSLTTFGKDVFDEIFMQQSKTLIS